MTNQQPTASPSWPVFSFLAPQFAIWIGAPTAIACACVYGLPVHAIVAFFVMAHVVGFGVTLGFHRLFCHKSYETSRFVEWILMACGCASGQASPFYWIAHHRAHHRHSDRPGDPHSPHVDRSKSWLKRFWHAHHGWTFGIGTYDPNAVRDLAKRRDLAWLDRYWYVWYLVGLSLPTLAGYLIGGTAYDALMGLLWGGLLRHAASHQGSYLVNSVGHLWGSRPNDTGDHSRNNPILAVLTLGEGWHNNHHAQPYSARHGFHWWQSDPTWNLLWVMERFGLVWRVKRPKLDAPKANEIEVAPEATPVEPVPVAAAPEVSH